jgi:hypothetical protein
LCYVKPVAMLLDTTHNVTAVAPKETCNHHLTCKSTPECLAAGDDDVDVDDDFSFIARQSVAQSPFPRFCFCEGKALLLLQSACRGADYSGLLLNSFREAACSHLRALIRTLDEDPQQIPPTWMQWILSAAVHLSESAVGPLDRSVHATYTRCVCTCMGWGGGGAWGLRGYCVSVCVF